MRMTKAAGALALALTMVAGMARPAQAQRGAVWLLGDAGAAAAGGGSYTGNAALFADGGIGVALNETMGIQAMANGLFGRANDCTAIILGQCGRAFPQTTGVTVGIVTNDQGLGMLHTGGFVAGVGAFRTRTLSNQPTTTGGLYLGGEGTIFEAAHASVDVSGRVIVLPRVSKQMLFIFPLTVGFRVW